MSHNRLSRARVTRSARRRVRSAFTLIELLLVLVILAILTSVVVVNFVNKPDQARKVAAQHDIHTIEMGVDAFKIETGRYPTSDEGLNALMVQPGNVRGWNGPYLKSMPVDPWAHPYIYHYPGAHNPNTYDLLSAGPDGQEGGDDDITNWSKE